MFNHVKPVLRSASQIPGPTINLDRPQVRSSPGATWADCCGTKCLPHKSRSGRAINSCPQNRSRMNPQNSSAELILGVCKQSRMLICNGLLSAAMDDFSCESTVCINIYTYTYIYIYVMHIFVTHGHPIFHPHRPQLIWALRWPPRPRWHGFVLLTPLPVMSSRKPVADLLHIESTWSCHCCWHKFLGEGVTWKTETKTSHPVQLIFLIRFNQLYGWNPGFLSCTQSIHPSPWCHYSCQDCRDHMP